VLQISTLLIKARMTRQETIYVAIVDDDESSCRSFSRLMRASTLSDIVPSAEAFLEDRNIAIRLSGCSTSN